MGSTPLVNLASTPSFTPILFTSSPWKISPLSSVKKSPMVVDAFLTRAIYNIIMKYLKPIHEVKSIQDLSSRDEQVFERSPSYPNTPADGWIAPTHEQLADLYWFKALGQVLGTISGSAFWRTGDRAYANGTRQLSIHRDYSYRDELFVFYPKRGTLVDPDGGQTIKSGIPFATLEDWNSALFLVYLKVIARLLGLRTLTGLRTAILGKDSSTITQFFNSINQHLQSVGVDPRPESFLFAILSEISTPEEREVIRDLIQLGLI